MRNRLVGRQRQGSKGYNVWGFAVAVPLLLFLFQLDACTGSSINEESETVVREKTAESATVDEVLGNSDAFYGVRATVTGEVTEVISPLTFEIGGERNEDSASTRYGEGADGLLVVKDPDKVPDVEVQVGQTVQVTGPVREFDAQTIEDMIGAGLADGVFTYWAGHTSMIATSVEPAGDTTT